MTQARVSIAILAQLAVTAVVVCMVTAVARAQSASLVSVYGFAYGQDGVTPAPAGYTVRVRNTTSGRSLSYVLQTEDQGQYAVTFVDYDQNRAASVGDGVEVTLFSPRGQVANRPIAWPVLPAHVFSQLIRVDVRMRRSVAWRVFSIAIGDAATIQSAIDAAVPELGDSVVVMPGVYTWTNQVASGAAMIQMREGVPVVGFGDAHRQVLDAEGQGTVVACTDILQRTLLSKLTLIGGNATSGGGIQCTGANVEILGCVIHSNEAENGSGIACISSSPLVQSCTIVANTAGSAGAAILCDRASPTLDNCIVALNLGAAMASLDASSAPAVGCCDLWDNSGGNTLPPGGIDLGGNFSLSPEFCAPGEFDYRLTPDSPCLDAQGGCGRVGALGAGCQPTSAGGFRDYAWLRLASPLPNPMARDVEIRFSLGHPATVDLSVFSVTGRLVKRLVRGPRPMGDAMARWDATDGSGLPVPNGVYVLRLESPGSGTRTAKLTVLR